MVSLKQPFSILVVTIFAIIFIDETIAVRRCARAPRRGVPHSQKTSGDGMYEIYIANEPMGYQPGKVYNVFLLGARTENKQFKRFLLNARAVSNPDRSRARYSQASPRRVGRFQLFDDSLTEFSGECVNTVAESDDLEKTEIQVLWTAPASGSGCVAFSAMVYENQNSWYADENKLTKILCEGEEEKKRDDSECCACDEAKYEFTFEGIWSNETHPRDFPFAVWLTHFSDVIGASHDSNFSFWGENHISTDGFRSLAEWGSVRALEIELRAKGPRLRTLVKAAGLWYPNVNTNTTAQFRVDRVHHKVSLASMFGPSPDWVVGVSGLNLCNRDCTWKDSLDIDLYPWDAGTDTGITYMSPNAETFPRERMYQITTMFPEDPRQPFYNPNSKEMTPLARLYIRKTRSITHGCDEEFIQSQVLEESENTEDGVERPECRVTSYSAWSPCSVTCGKGIRARTRQYANEDLAKQNHCNRQLINKEMCVGSIPECPNTGNNEEQEENLAETAANVNEAGEGLGVCRTTPYSEWSPCSVTCGIGISMRTRNFIEHAGRKKCPHVTIVEKEKCMRPDCSIDETEVPDPMCPTTQWSDWSPCSTSCGRGVRIRSRLLLVNDPMKKEECMDRHKLSEQQECTQRERCSFDREEARTICNLESDQGPCRGSYDRFSFNPAAGKCESFNYGGCRGNQNNFFSRAECENTCREFSLAIVPRQALRDLQRPRH